VTISPGGGPAQKAGMTLGPVAYERRSEGLLRLAVGLLRAPDMPTIMSLAVREVEQGLDADQVLIVEPDETEAGMHVLASGTGNGHVGELALVKALFARTLAESQPLILPTDGQALPAELPVGRTASWMSCALAGSQGPAGMLCVLSEQPHCFSPADGRYLQVVADLLGAGMARLQSEMQMNALGQELNRTGIRRALHLLGLDLVQELSQPATAALNYLYSCRNPASDGDAEPAEIGRLQGKAIAEIRRLTGIVSRLRETLKDGEVTYESTDINALIGTVLTLLRFRMVNGNIRLEYHPQGDLPAVRVDKAMMLQLFFNLFRICINAMHQSVRRELWVTTSYLPPERIEIRIAGSAPGVEGKVMDQRHALESLKDMEGGEIDMAICRYIIGAHDGEFRATILPGGGITLSITLPLNEECKQRG